MDKTRLLLSRKEASEVLGVSLVKFDQIVKSGSLGYVEIGRSKRFSREELEKWVDKNIRRGREEKDIPK